MSAAPPGAEFEQRLEIATRIVQRGLLQAEEKYLVAADASLGTWFARVGETISVAFRSSLQRIAEERDLMDADVRGEQLGLLADIAAEGIRGSSKVWRRPGSPRAHDEILGLVCTDLRPTEVANWTDVLTVNARCCAALEPVANGLREGDLPIGGSTERERVLDSFATVVTEAFSGVFALC